MQSSLTLLVANLVLITGLVLVVRKTQNTLFSWTIIALTALSAIVATIGVTSVITFVIAISFIWAFLNNSRLLSKRREYMKTGSVVWKGWMSFMLLYFFLSALDYVLVDAALIALLSFISLGVALSILFFTIYHAFVYRIGKLAQIDASELPSVTLAIPARNETHAIRETLTEAVASEYSRLEILVIDDCSQDRTPQIIRDFAHDGIRFIQGTELNENWL